MRQLPRGRGQGVPAQLLVSKSGPDARWLVQLARASPLTLPPDSYLSMAVMSVHPSSPCRPPTTPPLFPQPEAYTEKKINKSTKGYKMLIF